MKPKFIISIIAVILIAILAFRFTQKKPAVEETALKKPVEVTAQTVANSNKFKKTINYPAIIASDQQITLAAATNGTVTSLNFDLGKNISQGQRLATIDSVGTISKRGENGLKDSRIQALELAVESADQSYRLAKKTHKHHENYANKRAKEIAEANLASAHATLNGALDERFVSAPISGTITQKFVSTGDSINAGQSIATISKLNKIEIQFFVNKEELSYFKIGDEISIKENNLAYPGKITLISPQADETTKRFLVEATPIENKQLIIGSVVSVEFSIDYLPQSNENIILPLSAITISQNESYIFIAKDQKVQKVSVVIVKVFGEMAEIKTSLAPQDEIVTDGSRIIKEGDEIVIKK